MMLPKIKYHMLFRCRKQQGNANKAHKCLTLYQRVPVLSLKNDT